MEGDSVTTGDRIKALRLEQHMTQAQLAVRLGLASGLVSFYELNERSPSNQVLMKLAGIFRVSVDYLLGLEKRTTIDVTDLSPENIAIITTLANALKEKQ